MAIGFSGKSTSLHRCVWITELQPKKFHIAVLDVSVHGVVTCEYAVNYAIYLLSYVYLRSSRDGSSPKFWKGGIAPISPSSPSPFSSLSETEKYELHIGLYMCEICHQYGCQLCNGLDPATRRNEARRADSGGEILDRGQLAPPHQL